MCLLRDFADVLETHAGITGRLIVSGFHFTAMEVM
jgi:hypothetical protein